MKQQEETVTVSATFYFKTNEIIRTKMTVPMIDGIIAILAITGLQVQGDVRREQSRSGQ